MHTEQLRADVERIEYFLNRADIRFPRRRDRKVNPGILFTHRPLRTKAMKRTRKE